VPKALLLALLALPLEVFGQGITVQPHPSGAGVEVTHHGGQPVIALKVGERGLLSLFPGDRLHLQSAADATISGRFSLAHWGAALGDLSTPWAEYHLRTAGAYLDALTPGRDGIPKEASNVSALDAVESAVFTPWIQGPPLRLALVARAARHGPVALLSKMLSATSPTDAYPPWPEAYAILDTLPDLMRDAIEAKGAEIVPALLTHPVWAADRGFGDPVLGWAFPALRAEVRSALAGRRDPATAAALDAVKVDPGADFTARLGAAMDADRMTEALALASHAAARWTVEGTAQPEAEAARLTCATLDGAVVTAMRGDRLLAAEAYLASRARPAATVGFIASGWPISSAPSERSLSVEVTSTTRCSGFMAPTTSGSAPSTKRVSPTPWPRSACSDFERARSSRAARTWTKPKTSTHFDHGSSKP